MADLLAPEAFASQRGDVYLTDGKRLCEVLGLDANDNFRLADCYAACDDPEAVITVNRDELARDWKIVQIPKEEQLGE